MFLVVSVCSRWGFHVAITYDALALRDSPLPPSDMFKLVKLGLYYTGTPPGPPAQGPPRPPRSDIWWILKDVE